MNIKWKRGLPALLTGLLAACGNTGISGNVTSASSTSTLDNTTTNPVNTTSSTTNTANNVTANVATTAPNSTTSNAANSTTTTTNSTTTTTTKAVTTAPDTTNSTSATTVAATTTATASSFQPFNRQIAAANTCFYFDFASDGRFYCFNKPASGQSGTYTRYAGNPNDALKLLTTNFGQFSSDLSLLAVPTSSTGNTVIVQSGSGAEVGTVANRSTPTFISPDKKRIAYLLRSTQQDSPEAPQYFTLWTGNIDGSSLKSIWSLREGKDLQWFPDSRHLLLAARDESNQRFGLWVIDTQGQTNQNATLIVQSKGLWQCTLSADGKRVIYAVVFQGDSSSGVWSANADGSNRQKFNWQGDWRWSRANPNELFYFPVKTSGSRISADTLWSHDFASGKAQALTTPATLPLHIMNKQWQATPDGKSLAYRNATDNAVWYARFRA